MAKSIWVSGAGCADQLCAVDEEADDNDDKDIEDDRDDDDGNKEEDAPDTIEEDEAPHTEDGEEVEDDVEQRVEEGGRRVRTAGEFVRWTRVSSSCVDSTGVSTVQAGPVLIVAWT